MTCFIKLLSYIFEKIKHFMKILPQNLISYTGKVNSDNKKPSSVPVNSLPCDEFNSKKEKKQSDLELFSLEVSKKYPDEPLESAVRKIISDEKNLIGQGNQKLVYKISNSAGYVIGKFRYKEPSNSEIKLAENILPEYNFGQPVLTNGGDLIVMKKIEGTSHSLPDWLIRYREVVNGEGRTTKENAEKFLSSMEKIEKFPLQSYVDFANKLKYLSDRNIKADNINPNNVLVDCDKQAFHYIDLILPHEQKFFEPLERPLNTVDDMIALLCDPVMQSAYLNALDKNDAQILKEKTANVIENCEKAGKIAGLQKGAKNVEKMYLLGGMLEEKKVGTKNKMVEYYNEFLRLYKPLFEN